MSSNLLIFCNLINQRDKYHQRFKYLLNENEKYQPPIFSKEIHIGGTTDS